MNWEDLTAPDFAKAVKKVKGVCIISMGCIEKHGEHLPLGTDLFQGLHVAREAAKREPAIVFPPYYFTQIHEAKHQPGTIAVPGAVLWSLLLACCDEIARNGLTKIILHIAHGGNCYLVPYFCQMALEKERPYTLYSSLGNWEESASDKKLREKIEKVSREKAGGHAGEGETSDLMVVCPHLVKMKDHIAARGVPRPKPQPHLYSGIWWYAEAPHHYMGQAALASKEKGELYLEKQIRDLTKVIRAVKNDTAYPRLQKEFFRKIRH